MPTISIDTFFACSLMIILVLAAMINISRIVYPQINNEANENNDELFSEISKYILLNSGTPSNWGQNSQLTPETFGLAEVNAEVPYKLDIDKVSRLNSENIYSLSYGQIFTALKIPDVAFNIKINSLFETSINLTSTLEETNETIYTFNVVTERRGIPVQTELKYYLIAENFLKTSTVQKSNGAISFNVTISNSINGPAFLFIFARAKSNIKIVSFNIYSFEHNSAKPKPKGTFLRLSPINYTLNVSFQSSNVTLSKAYGLTFNHSSILTQITKNNNSATYRIPHLLDSSPMLFAVTGWNSTTFFTEWTAYPQIPLETGMNFSEAATLSDVFTYTYTVTINTSLFECIIQIGGVRDEG